jgi:N-acetylmuramoyl-L-alanine amidase
MAKKRGASAAGNRKKSTGASGHAPRKGLERVLLLMALGLLGVMALLGWVGGQGGVVTGLLSGGETARVAGQRIGIIAGHSGNDSGAVCEDGRTEAEAVQRIVARVVRRLERAGASVDVLEEYDERLDGYTAGAMVSIHADSCIDRSGFKVARAAASTKAELEDFLVGCLGARYAETTAIPFDASTITEDMTEYHAFKRVAPSTPSAIIETGFLAGDWPVIGEQPDLAAAGIADGVICFFEGLQPAASPLASP